MDAQLLMGLHSRVSVIVPGCTNPMVHRVAQVRDSVAIHVPCSSKKMGIANAFETVAGKCAHEVVPTGVPCCGAPTIQAHHPAALVRVFFS